MPPSIEFVNHASVLVDSGEGVRVLSDPWLDGLTFNNGWTLLTPSRFTEADFDRVTHIWISHEHPDHFNPPTLKRIPESRRAQITVLYQSAPDLAAAREIQAFCRRLGFRDFVEVPPDAPLPVGPNLELSCRHHLWGDSWCHIALPSGPEGRRWTIFNANDCEWEAPEVGKRVFGELGTVDVLLMQFSYACWYPDRDARRREAARLIDRLVMMTNVSGARYVIPFASFVWFCHEENIHSNDEINTIERAAEAVDSLTSARAVVLHPGDVWTLGATPDNAEALRRYADDYARMRAATPTKTAVVDFETLRGKLAAFASRNVGPGRPNAAGPDIRLFLRDLGHAVHWRGDLERDATPEHDCDLSLSSDSFAYMLDTRWGTGTLGVNGRFGIPAGSRYRSLGAIELAIVHALGRRNWLIAGSVDTKAYGAVPPPV